jgi:hypothetical protein
VCPADYRVAGTGPRALIRQGLRHVRPGHLAIAGDLAGEFPHVRIPGDKDHHRINPANLTRMRDPDAAGQTKYWIIEVHPVDRDRTFGGFYERLLVPADRFSGSA